MSGEEIVRKYLDEGLVALLPVYRGGVEGTEVFTLSQTYQLYHSISWSLELLARYCCIDLQSLRRYSRRFLEVRHHIPLPFSRGLVLLPVKVRDGVGLGETTVGFVNYLQIEGLEGAVSTGAGAAGLDRIVSETPGALTQRCGGGGEKCRSHILCRGSVVIRCMNTVSTVKTKLRQGELLCNEMTKRQQLLAVEEKGQRGLSGAALRQLLPACDCLLRDIMLLLLDRIPAGAEK